MTATVVHLTSRHPWDDVRIFHKMCRQLAADGHDVALVTVDGTQGGADFNRDGVRVLRLVPQGTGLVPRRLANLAFLLQRAARMRPAIVQAHDPDLIPVLCLLRLLGRRTVFDAHEDFVTQICARYPNRPFVRGIAGVGLRFLQALANMSATRIIAATDQVATCHPPRKTTVVNNYPVPSEFSDPASKVALSQRPARAAYVGALARVRGIEQLVLAAGQSRHLVGLDLVGRFDDDAFADHLRGLPGWDKVTVHGHLSRRGVASVLSQVRVGLVTLHPLPNYVTARPVKLFEYLAAGLPVIHSNFPVWSEIFHEDTDQPPTIAHVGWAVNPLDPAKIALALDSVLSDPDPDETGHAARELSRQYRWATEGRRYSAMINGILPRSQTNAILSWDD